jgi:alkanesulfonate monooxygenase SsuD/methylene tetrahydromethanopterin reductase-like flavin-dependent oxidoreductase (luciferase family)
VQLGIELPFTAGVGSTWYRRFSMPVERVKLADRLGYDMVFVAETGQDCFGPMGFVLGVTERIGVGSRLMQVGARSAAAAAIAFQTLDGMAGGRTVLAGIGSSQVERHEAWHGAPWGSPYWRMHDYVAVMRKVFAGEPLDYRGHEIRVPYDGEDAARVGPVTVLTEPNPDVPILVGASTPMMTKLTARIADGWFPYGFCPGLMDAYRPLLDEGFKRSGRPKARESFQIWAHVDVIITDDIADALLPFKRYAARLHRGTPQMAWRGYADVEERVQELWSAGRYDDAAQAIPDEYVDDGMLVGPLGRVTNRIGPWLESGLTGLIIRSESDDAYEALYRAARPA